MVTFRHSKHFPTRKDLRDALRMKFGSIKEASNYLGVSYTNLSRIIQGKRHELRTHIKILVALDLLPDHRYIFPKEDLETFELLNNLR